MDIVDNIEQAEVTEQAPESVEGVPYTEDTFRDAWQSGYTQLMETLRRVYEQIGNGMREEMAGQIPDFDPQTNEEHKTLFENSVVKQVVQIGAQDNIMATARGFLVAMLDVGRRYSFSTKDLSATLEKIHPTPKVETPGDIDGTN